jgi:hypothetical protein
MLVKVYVRLGDNEAERRLTFALPAEVNQIDVLEMGFALDGNQCVAIVTGECSPVEALLEMQRRLVSFFKERGYDTQFA